MSVVVSLFDQLNAATVAALRNTAVLAVIFTLVRWFVPACNQMPAWWRKPDLSTDLCWALVPNLLYKFAQMLLVLVGIMAGYGITAPDQVAAFFTDGHGLLAGAGFWPQVVLYLVGSDLLLYGTHRLFHGNRLWRFHVVHHSSKHLEWLSAVRFHPVDRILHGILPDVAMLLLGIPPNVLIWLMPFNVGSSALVHANLDCGFGPFRYLIASPRFHRWHHTSAARGGSSNFAGTFPFIDLAFGTFYMPRGQRPDAYGVEDAGFPADFAGQLLHPFRPNRGRQLAEGARRVDVSPDQA